MNVYHQKRKNPATGRIVENPTYYGNYTLPWENGVRHTVSLRTTDKRIAEKRLGEFVRVKELTHEKMPVPASLWGAPSQGLAELLKRYGKSLQAQSRTPKHVRDTIARVARVIDECRWGSLQDVSALSFERWRSSGLEGLRSHKPLSAKALKEYQVSLNAFFRWLINMGLAEENPLEKVPVIETRGKETENRRAWTREELNHFMYQAPACGKVDYRSAIFILFMTGLRREELQKLLWGDVLLDEAAPYLIVRARNSKNRESQPVFLLPEVTNYLRQMKPRDALATEVVLPYRIPTAKTLRKDMAALGIAARNEFGKLDFHSLRHSCATMLANCGVSPNAARQILRHHDVRLTLNSYTHTTGGAVAAELKKVPYVLDRCTTYCTPTVVSERPKVSKGGNSPTWTKFPQHLENCKRPAGL